MGNDASLVKISEEFRTNKVKYESGEGGDIPIAKVAAIAAGVVLNDNMVEFSVYCK